MSLDTFVEDLSTDCKIYLSTNKGKPLVPYCVVNDYYDVKLSHKIVFPETGETMSRPQQYHILASFINHCFSSRVGIVSFVSLDAPARPEIDQRLWGKTVTAALVGAAQSGAAEELSATYESCIIVFDYSDDGELIFSEIKDDDVWQDIIDNVTIFRDFLYYSTVNKKANVFRWTTFYKTLVNAGFLFEFENEDTKAQFAMAQYVLYPNR